MNEIRRTIVLVLALSLVPVSWALAHEMTVQGTVAAVEATRIQVKTGKEKAGVEPAWYVIDAKTKIKRGKKTVTLDGARVQLNERVVVIVDHPDDGPMVTKEVRLAEK